VATLTAKTKLDNTGFNTGIQGMEGQVSGFSSNLSRLSGVIGAAFSIGAVINFSRAITSASSQLEDIGVQFDVLFGGTNKARLELERIKEFSARTPFQIADIAEATRLLVTFSAGALGGNESLKLVGDASAATANELQGVALWVGRAFDAIQAGRPFGEAAARLQEMGILTGIARAKMEELGKAGADGEEIFGVLTSALGKFSGGMEKMSQTVSGKASTLADNFNLLFAEIGDGFKPANIAVKDFGINVTQAFRELITPVQKDVDRLTGLLEKVESDFKEAEVVLEPEIKIPKLTKAEQEKERLKLRKQEEKLLERFFKLVEDQRQSELSLNEKIKDRQQTLKDIKDDLEDNSTNTKVILELEIERLTVQKELNKLRKEETKEAERLAKIDKRENEILSETDRKLDELKEGKGITVGPAVSDRLARIGGQIGGAVSPSARTAERNLQLDEKRNILLEKLNRDLVKLETDRGLD